MQLWLCPRARALPLRDVLARDRRDARDEKGPRMTPLPVTVRVALDLREIWLRTLRVETFRQWLDAFESLTDAEASLYARSAR